MMNRQPEDGPQQQPQRGQVAAAPVTASCFVTELGSNDVLVGRGMPVNSHEGNRRFRELVASRKREYSSTKLRLIKDRIARGIIDVITQQRGGRFLRRVESASEAKLMGVPKGVPAWAFVSEDAVVQKTKQALRDHELPSQDQSQVSPRPDSSPVSRNVVAEALQQYQEASADQSSPSTRMSTAHSRASGIYYEEGKASPIPSGIEARENAFGLAPARPLLTSIVRSSAPVPSSLDGGLSIGTTAVGEYLMEQRFAALRQQLPPESGRDALVASGTGPGVPLDLITANNPVAPAPADLLEVAFRNIQRDQAAAASELGSPGLRSAQQGAGPVVRLLPRPSQHVGIDSSTTQSFVPRRPAPVLSTAESTGREVDASPSSFWRAEQAAGRSLDRISRSMATSDPRRATTDSSLDQGLRVAQQQEESLKGSSLRFQDSISVSGATHLASIKRETTSTADSSEARGDLALTQGIERVQKRTSTSPSPGVLVLSFLEVQLLRVVSSIGLPVWTSSAFLAGTDSNDSEDGGIPDFRWIDLGTIFRSRFEKAAADVLSATAAAGAALLKAIDQQRQVAGSIGRDPLALAKQTVMLLECLYQSTSSSTRGDPRSANAPAKTSTAPYEAWFGNQLGLWAASLHIGVDNEDGEKRPLPYSTQNFFKDFPDRYEAILQESSSSSFLLQAADLNGISCQSVYSQVACLTRLRSIATTAQVTNQCSAPRPKSQTLQVKLAFAALDCLQATPPRVWSQMPSWWGATLAGTRGGAAGTPTASQSSNPARYDELIIELLLKEGYHGFGSRGSGHALKSTTDEAHLVRELSGSAVQERIEQLMVFLHRYQSSTDRQWIVSAYQQQFKDLFKAPDADAPEGELD